MTNLFIIHGISGNSQENWFPWLKEKLEPFGVDVIIPNFPTPNSPKLSLWLDHFKQYHSDLNEESIIIGHSLGVPFLLSLLEKHPVKAAFFVAGFSSLPDNQFKDEMKTFIKDFNWQKIKENCSQFHVFHSDNDPYVSIDKAEELKEKLQAELTIVPNAGHFNTPAGYDKFELLLDNVKELIK
jgi:uncharacterized protein